MCWSPLGKFNSYFSIVSTLRGQYITVNESCQFYYQWSTDPQIKQAFIYPHISPVSQNSLAWSACYSRRPPRPPFPRPPGPCFSPPSTFFLSLRVCLQRCSSTCIDDHTAAAPHTSTPPPFPSSLPVAPSPPRRVYWRPDNERARQRQRQPQANPGGPCLTAHTPSSSRISTVCCLVHTDQAVSSSRIPLLRRLPVLIPPRPSDACLSGICMNGRLALFLHAQEPQLKHQFADGILAKWHLYWLMNTILLWEYSAALSCIKSWESEKTRGGKDLSTSPSVTLFG